MVVVMKKNKNKGKDKVVASLEIGGIITGVILVIIYLIFTLWPCAKIYIVFDVNYWIFNLFYCFK